MKNLSLKTRPSEEKSDTVGNIKHFCDKLDIDVYNDGIRHKVDYEVIPKT